MSAIEPSAGSHTTRGAESFLTDIAFWLFVAVLAWAPFPLGSNRPWSWNLLSALVAASWTLWGIGTWSNPKQNWEPLRAYLLPFILGSLGLGWSLVQVCPWVPSGWIHPVWGMASATLGHPIAGAISLSPWHTITECLKLATYVMALWLTYVMTRRAERAVTLLNAIVAIGAFYALYAAVLKITGYAQFEIFYATQPFVDRYASGPFVLHNTYATYAGLSALAALVRLVTYGAETIVTSRGVRIWALSGLQYLFGRGLGYFFAFLICFSTLLASASRAGFLATMCGLLVMLVSASATSAKRVTRAWSLVAVGSLFALVLGLVALSGDTLAGRLNVLVDAGNADEIRLALWSAALRMIADAPLLGLGLGTFQDAYPLYASHVLPYIIDKAHNDYLEFSAGLGLPAALAWWTAWLLLAVACFRGIFVRRRNRQFVFVAAAASVLVAVHSAFDFSLQIPAVALLYAALLGLGLAQSRPTKARI